MALEDCEILAMLLTHHQNQGHDGWRLASKLYSDMRIPRLRWIRQEAEKRSGMKQDMGILQEMLMYFIIWVSCEYALSEYWIRAPTDTLLRQDWSLHKTRPAAERIRCACGGQQSLSWVTATQTSAVGQGSYNKYSFSPLGSRSSNLYITLRLQMTLRASQ